MLDRTAEHAVMQGDPPVLLIVHTRCYSNPLLITLILGIVPCFLVHPFQRYVSYLQKRALLCLPLHPPNPGWRPRALRVCVGRFHFSRTADSVDYSSTMKHSPFTPILFDTVLYNLPHARAPPPPPPSLPPTLPPKGLRGLRPTLPEHG